MTATAPTAPTAPVARKPAEIAPMLGGGQPELTAEDLRERTLSFRVNVECKTDDREGTACVPIYEHPLLKARYQAIGGDARITADWLPAKMKYPRVVPLNMDMLRAEIRRLEASYLIHLPNGKSTSLFKEIYGRDGDPIKGFYKVINLQVKAWRALEARVRGGHRMTAEDLAAISEIASPKTEFEAPEVISDFSDGTIDSDTVLKGPEDEGMLTEDPLADLQEFLGSKGWDIDVIMDVCKAVGDKGDLTALSIGSLPSMHGKKSDCHRMMNDFKAWIKAAEKKVAAAAANKAAKEHLGELTA